MLRIYAEALDMICVMYDISPGHDPHAEALDNGQSPCLFEHVFCLIEIAIVSVCNCLTVISRPTFVACLSLQPQHMECYNRP